VALIQALFLVWECQIAQLILAQIIPSLQ